MLSKTSSTRVFFVFVSLSLSILVCTTCLALDNRCNTSKFLNYTQISNNEHASKIDENKGYAIPFDYQPPQRPLITIQIRVNKSKPLTFLVDTGWETAFFVLPWAVKELNLHSTGETTTLHPGNSTIRALESCDIDLLAPPPLPSAGLHVEIPWSGDVPLLDYYPGPRIAGIIGGDLFLAITARFDFDKKTFTLFYDKHAPLKLAKPAITLPLVKTGSGIVPQVNLVLPGNVPALFTVDTGGVATTLPAETAKKVTIVAKNKTYLANLGGFAETEKLLLSQLLLGSTAIPIVPITVGAPSSQAGLGIDLLSRFRVTIDGRNGFLTLEPRSHYETRMVGNPGITIKKRNDSPYVDAITKPSPLTAAIKVGDKITAIDGRTTKEMTYAEAIYRLDDYEGTDAKLTLERADGKSFEVTLPRRSDFYSVVRSETGIRLLADRKNLLRVIYIEPKSLAEQAGIEMSDELVAIDGKPAKMMTLDEIISKLEINGQDFKKTESLILKRKRDGKTIELKVEGSKQQ